jgi:helicase MOV-10
MPPSTLFYDDSLVPCAVNGTITWSGLPNPHLPLLFIGSESKEECVDEVFQPFQPLFNCIPTP